MKRLKFKVGDTCWIVSVFYKNKKLKLEVKSAKVKTVLRCNFYDYFVVLDKKLFGCDTYKMEEARSSKKEALKVVYDEYVKLHIEAELRAMEYSDFCTKINQTIKNCEANGED
jgi:hypothetical protein